MQIEFIDQNHVLFDDVKSLGDKNSSTLGFMPEGAFMEHANKKCIIIASEENQLTGYLMFRRVPRSYRLAIVHLCIKDEFRGKNISNLLLDALRDKYRNSIYNGIILSCRTDYTYASKLWERYGFICKHTKRSRSIEENHLNLWWYDFNNPDLFTVSNGLGTRIKALLDANIIIKLRDNKEEYEPAQDPRSLLADWLTEEVDYFYAPEIYNEIVRDKNKDRVQQTRSFLNHFIEAKINIEECKRTAELLKDIITGNTDNDNSDRIQLATAIVSEVSYFITLDNKILEKRNIIENSFNIQIFTPQELILEIDQLLNKEDYSPAKLSGVVFHSIAKISNYELDPYIDTFLNKSNSENKRSFGNIVYHEVSNIENARVKTVKTITNDPIAFFGYNINENILVISFIRLLETEYKQTLFMQLISDFINKTIKKGLLEIHLKESFLSTEQESILNRMGFDKAFGIWIKKVLNKTINSHHIKDLDNKLENYPLIEKLAIATTEEKKYLLLELERKLFPLKILDLELPCYIIPIKPYWAGQLFDPYIAGTNLFGADGRKIWNYENVYYRSIKPITEKAPARILWYASADADVQRSKAIIASSYLDEVMTGKPKDLFRQNKHYGIYEWKNIYDLCKSNIENPIRALRFSGTEVFNTPVSFQKVREIFVENGKLANTFASPVLIESNIFNHIYQLGTTSENR